MRRNKTTLGILAFGLLTIAVIVQRFRKSNDDPCMGFIPIAGNLTEASLIFLAEDHFRFETNSIPCLEDLTQGHPQHKILCEAIDYNTQFPCNELSITEKPGRECWGLENEDNLKNYLQSFTTQDEIKKIKILLSHPKLKVQLKTDHDLDVYLEKYQNKLLLSLAQANKTQSEIKKYQNRDKYRINTLKEIFNLRQKGISYKDILDQLESEQAVTEMMLDRNTAMLEGAMYHHGIFRIAVIGRAHIDPTVSSSNKGSKKAAEGFLNDLKQQKESYAVLSYRHK